MKISGKTERPNKFTLKRPWQSLVSEAEKVGKTALARCVLWKRNTIHRVTEQNTTISNVQKREQWREVLIMNGLVTAAHSDALRSVLQYIQENISKENNIVQLSSLRLIYVDKLEEHGYPNDQYRSVNLMNRLQSHPDISPQIVFCKVYTGD